MLSFCPDWDGIRVLARRPNLVLLTKSSLDTVLDRACFVAFFALSPNAAPGLPSESSPALDFFAFLGVEPAEISFFLSDFSRIGASSSLASSCWLSLRVLIDFLGVFFRDDEEGGLYSPSSSLPVFLLFLLALEDVLCSSNSSDELILSSLYLLRSALSEEEGAEPLADLAGVRRVGTGGVFAEDLVLAAFLRGLKKGLRFPSDFGFVVSSNFLFFAGVEESSDRGFLLEPDFADGATSGFDTALGLELAGVFLGGSGSSGEPEACSTTGKGTLLEEVEPPVVAASRAAALAATVGTGLIRPGVEGGLAGTSVSASSSRCFPFSVTFRGDGPAERVFEDASDDEGLLLLPYVLEIGVFGCLS